MGLLSDYLFKPRPRRLGWLPNEPDERDREWSPKMGASPARLPFATLEAFVPTILNQGQTSSCVWQAIEAAVAIREAVLGLVYNPLSARAGYVMTLAAHGSVKVDGGTYPRSGFRVLGRHGCPLKSEWPWDERKVLQIPPSTMLLRGFKHSGFRYEFITASGDAKLEQIRLAIGEGLPVFFGTQVTRLFANHRGGGVFDGDAQPSLGGHAMVIVGHRPGAFRILNSWGRGWGDRGLAWVSDRWVRDSFRDLTICQGWPAEVAAQKELGR